MQIYSWYIVVVHLELLICGQNLDNLKNIKIYK